MSVSESESLKAAAHHASDSYQDVDNSDLSVLDNAKFDDSEISHTTQSVSTHQVNSATAPEIIKANSNSNSIQIDTEVVHNDRKFEFYGQKFEIPMINQDIDQQVSIPTYGGFQFANEEEEIQKDCSLIQTIELDLASLQDEDNHSLLSQQQSKDTNSHTNSRCNSRLASATNSRCNSRLGDMNLMQSYQESSESGLHSGLNSVDTSQQQKQQNQQLLQTGVITNGKLRIKQRQAGFSERFLNFLKTSQSDQDNHIHDSHDTNFDDPDDILIRSARNDDIRWKQLEMESQQKGGPISRASSKDSQQTVSTLSHNYGSQLDLLIRASSKESQQTQQTVLTRNYHNDVATPKSQAGIESQTITPLDSNMTNNDNNSQNQIQNQKYKKYLEKASSKYNSVLGDHSQDDNLNNTESDQSTQCLSGNDTTGNPNESQSDTLTVSKTRSSLNSSASEAMSASQDSSVTASVSEESQSHEQEQIGPLVRMMMSQNQNQDNLKLSQNLQRELDEMRREIDSNQSSQQQSLSQSREQQQVSGSATVQVTNQNLSRSESTVDDILTATIVTQVENPVGIRSSSKSLSEADLNDSQQQQQQQTQAELEPESNAKPAETATATTESETTTTKQDTEFIKPHETPELYPEYEMYHSLAVDSEFPLDLGCLKICEQLQSQIDKDYDQIYDEDNQTATQSQTTSNHELRQQFIQSELDKEVADYEKRKTITISKRGNLNNSTLSNFNKSKRMNLSLSSSLKSNQSLNQTQKESTSKSQSAALNLFELKIDLLQPLLQSSKKIKQIEQKLKQLKEDLLKSLFDRKQKEDENVYIAGSNSDENHNHSLYAAAPTEDIINIRKEATRTQVLNKMKSKKASYESGMGGGGPGVFDISIGRGISVTPNSDSELGGGGVTSPLIISELNPNSPLSPVIENIWRNNSKDSNDNLNIIKSPISNITNSAINSPINFTSDLQNKRDLFKANFTDLIDNNPSKFAETQSIFSNSNQYYTIDKKIKGLNKELNQEKSHLQQHVNKWEKLESQVQFDETRNKLNQMLNYAEQRGFEVPGSKKDTDSKPSKPNFKASQSLSQSKTKANQSKSYQQKYHDIQTDNDSVSDNYSESDYTESVISEEAMNNNSKFNLNQQTRTVRFKIPTPGDISVLDTVSEASSSLSNYNSSQYSSNYFKSKQFHQNQSQTQSQYSTRRSTFGLAGGLSVGLGHLTKRSNSYRNKSSKLEILHEGQTENEETLGQYENFHMSNKNVTGILPQQQQATKSQQYSYQSSAENYTKSYSSNYTTNSSTMLNSNRRYSPVNIAKKMIDKITRTTSSTKSQYQSLSQSQSSEIQQQQLESGTSTRVLSPIHLITNKLSSPIDPEAPSTFGHSPHKEWQGQKKSLSYSERVLERANKRHSNADSNGNASYDNPFVIKSKKDQTQTQSPKKPVHEYIDNLDTEDEPITISHLKAGKYSSKLNSNSNRNFESTTTSRLEQHLDIEQEVVQEIIDVSQYCGVVSDQAETYGIPKQMMYTDTVDKTVDLLHEEAFSEVIREIIQ